MLKRLIILASIALFPACPPSPPDPTPTPTPTPIPESPKIVSGKWDPFLRGATNCCDDSSTPNVDEGLADGWTLVTPEALDRIKGPGTVNFTHVRLGPYSEAIDVSKFSGFDREKAKIIQKSVLKYGPGVGILDDAREIGKIAFEKGITIEWDVVDNWALVNSTMNYYNDNCSVTKSAPPQRYLDWINAVVDATWDLPGIYNLGNEGFRCRPSPEWENGLYNALKYALSLKGVSRPIGSTVTIADKRVSFDYRTYHGWVVPPINWSLDIPAMLTETDNDSHDSQDWAKLARKTEESGMYVSIWRGPESWDSHNGAINAMPKLGDSWPPELTSCPKIPAPGSIVYMTNNPYPAGDLNSNKRDSSVKVRGDSEFCYLIHGVHVNDCHLEGWENRAACEMELISGCPVWEFKTPMSVEPALCDNDHNDLVSCDHFGDPLNRDNPDTPEFEGKPVECGKQSNEFGPYAGFFTAVHITPGLETFVRACKPSRDSATCGSWSLIIETLESTEMRRNK